MKFSTIQSTEGNKYVQVKSERELHKLGIESGTRASDKGGSWKRIAVSPIKRVRNSSLQIQATKT